MYANFCSAHLEKILGAPPQRDLIISSFLATVNFEMKYFLNEETEDILTDRYSDDFPWMAPNFAISTQT